MLNEFENKVYDHIVFVSYSCNKKIQIYSIKYLEVRSLTPKFSKVIFFLEVSGKNLFPCFLSF